MSRWSRVLFGVSAEDDREEMRELRYRLIMVLVFFRLYEFFAFLARGSYWRK